MADLELTRHYQASPAKVFETLTQPVSLLLWWGPEGMTIEPDNLDFTRLGPWGSVMTNAEGGRFKVTGQVTHLDPPNSVGFTWAWHDENDARGPESHVTLSVEPHDDGGSLFRLRHVDLPNEEAAKAHTEGWESTLVKLDALLST